MLAQSQKRDIHAMSFLELRTFEKKASEFLVSHKHLKMTEPQYWNQLFARYKQIVIVLDMKCWREINFEIERANQTIRLEDRPIPKRPQEVSGYTFNHAPRHGIGAG